MAELVFYTNPMSRGRTARWMLEEVGAPYRVERLAYGSPMKAPEYLALNPMGKVPTLRHGETVVTECAAILAYLADAFPEAELAPPAAERGAYYRWLFFCAGPLEAATTVQSLGVDVPVDKQGFVGWGNLDLTVGALERVVGEALGREGWLAGARFSAADLYCASYLGSGMQFGMIPRRDAFETYVARATARPAYARAKALDDAEAAETAPAA